MQSIITIVACLVCKAFSQILKFSATGDWQLRPLLTHLWHVEVLHTQNDGSFTKHLNRLYKTGF